MRRLIATSLALSALVFAGCGGGGDSGSALDSSLSYLPKDAPFALAIDTDLGGGQYEALQALLKKFPFGGQVQDNLLQQLEEGTNVDFNDDVKPVLGNPFVVGAPDVETFLSDSGGSAFVAAIQAKDKDALDNLIDKTKPKKTGEESGATLYEQDGSIFAVEDDTVIFAGDRQQLTQALARADGDDHLDEDTFNEGLDGLPDSALARVYADVGALLKNDPDTADALRVKWIAALRTLGATVVARNDGIDVDFRLRTEGDLSDEDLPIAPGDEAPEVIKQDGEIGLGIRDLAHIVKFAENAGQAVDPAGFGDYAKAKQTIDKQLGVSLDDDLIGQLTGNVASSISLDGKFGVRAELRDPAGVRAHARQGGRRASELRGGRRLRHRGAVEAEGQPGLLRTRPARRRRRGVRGDRRRARGRQRPRAGEAARRRGAHRGLGRQGLGCDERECAGAREHAAWAVRPAARSRRPGRPRRRSVHAAAGRPRRVHVRER